MNKESRSPSGNAVGFGDGEGALGSNFGPGNSGLGRDCLAITEKHNEIPFGVDVRRMRLAKKARVHTKGGE